MEQEELDKQLLDTQPEHLPEVPSEVPVAAPRTLHYNPIIQNQC